MLAKDCHARLPTDFFSTAVIILLFLAIFCENRNLSPSTTLWFRHYWPDAQSLLISKQSMSAYPKWGFWSYLQPQQHLN